MQVVAPELNAEAAPGQVRRGLFLGSIISVALLAFFYWQGQTFWVPDFVALLANLSLPILSIMMLFFPGHRLLGLIGLITTGAVLYTIITTISFTGMC